MPALQFWIDADEFEVAIRALAAAAGRAFTTDQLGQRREQLKVSWYRPDPTFAAELGVASSWAMATLGTDPDTTMSVRGGRMLRRPLHRDLPARNRGPIGASGEADSDVLSSAA